MRKIIVGGLAVTLGVATAAAGGAFAGGNGAQRSGLALQAGNNNDQCVEGSGAGTNGFVLINAPGKPGEARFVNGEVSLKNNPSGAETFLVNIYDVDKQMCFPQGELTTNAQGNGNAHLNYAGTSGGYYVVLQDLGGNEQYASQTVTAN